MMWQAARAVTFDAGNTLLHCDPTPAEIYSRVLSRHGRSVDAEEVGPIFSSVWTEAQRRTPAGVDRYGSVPGGERAWWGAFVREVLYRLDHEARWEILLDELYHEFSRPSAWHSYPEADEVLRALADAGLRLAIISNWDSRLPVILDALGLAPHFDTVSVSSLEKVEKPGRAIFDRTLERLGVPPLRAIHVGDGPLEDYRGAADAGMRPVLIDRAGLFVGTDMVRVDSLWGLMDLVGENGRQASAGGGFACSTR
jgi:putative hydrolase of the HAD superfamily